MDVQEAIEGIRLLKLEPGDRVAIHIPDESTPQERDELLDAFRDIQQSWGVKFLVFSGGIELTVIRED